MGSPPYSTDLLNCVYYLPQDSVLIEGTIEKNLLIDPRTIDYSWLNKCLDVLELETQLGTTRDTLLKFMLAEDGQNLSGGQRQRVLFLRALVRKPQILVLDEGTNGLDTEAEISLLKKIKNLDKSMSMLLVSHHTYLASCFDKCFKLTSRLQKLVNICFVP